MEKILFGSIIPDLTGKEITELEIGEVGMLLYSNDEAVAPVAVGSEITNAQIVEAKGIQFVRKDSTDNYDSSVVIPFKTLRNVNYQAYVAGVAGIFKLGDNANAGTGLTVEATGEGCIRLVDLTDSYTTTSFPANICLDKRSSETVAQYLARFVAKINADPVAKTLVIATVESSIGVHQLKLTTLNSSIKLGIATDGLFAAYQPITVTARVVAKGSGDQMVAIEKELTVFKGNGNYINDNDLYYKEPLKGNVAENYNTLSISWTGVAQPTISTTMAVANLNLLVAISSNNDSIQNIYDAILNISSPTIVE
jgi:hypothetical protein